MSSLIELRQVSKTYGIIPPLPNPLPHTNRGERGDLTFLSHLLPRFVGGKRRCNPAQTNTFTALKNINFQLTRGEMVAIIGVSGSGKSTLMNLIGFLDHCTTGQYFFNGKDVSHLSDDALADIRNQKIGFIFQSFFLLPRLNALQNVILPLSYRGTDPVQAKSLALAMLERVGVKNFATHYPNQLSGGQQQRVAIARALVGNPDVILADEPTGSLDAKTSQEIMDLFLELNQQEKRTIVIITHDREISQQCQRVVTLRDGAIHPQ